MDHDLYDYSPIVDREPIHWPGDARVAWRFPSVVANQLVLQVVSKSVMSSLGVRSPSTRRGR